MDDSSTDTVIDTHKLRNTELKAKLHSKVEEYMKSVDLNLKEINTRTEQVLCLKTDEV